MSEDGERLQQNEVDNVTSVNSCSVVSYQDFTKWVTTYLGIGQWSRDNKKPTDGWA